MATQQLLDYIKQQQQKGIPQETIKNSLISAGWKISDIEEAFGSLESPKGVEPPISRGSVGVGFQAFLQTVFNQRLILLVYIIGFLLVATWVFGYFYYFQSPEKIVQKMTQKMVEVKSLEYFGQIETEIKASNFIPSLPLGGGGSLFQPQQPSPAKQTGKFLINFNGVSDLQDLNKPKSVFKFGIDTDTDILPQGFRFGLEVRTIDKLTYLKLDNVPDLGFLDLNFLKDQWIKIDLETIVKQFGLEKLEEQLKTIQQEQEQEQELSPEQIEQLRKTIAKIKIFKITEKLASERIDGVNTYHYKLLIDKEGFIQLLTEINKIVQNKLITEKELAELNKSLEAIALPEVEIWIGKKDLLLYKILFSHTIKETEQTKASGKFTIRVQFKNYNKPVQIEIPKSVKTLGEILGELLGPTGLQLTDETANWKTYTNPNFKFSIKYPSNMIYEEPSNDTYLLLVAFRDPTKSVSADNFSVEVVNSKKLEDEIKYRRWEVEGHMVIKDGIKETRLIDKGYEEAKLEFDIVDPSSNSTQHSVIVILKSEKYNYVVSANNNITNADFIDKILPSFQILK